MDVNLPARGLAYCQQADELLEALTEAVRELVRLAPALTI